MVKYGLIGISAILPRFVQGLKSSFDSQAYAVSSRSLTKAKDFAVAHDIPCYYGDYQELLKNPDVDIVYISTTNATHYAIAHAALSADKNVILEKPFTADYQQAITLIELAQQKQLFLMEGQKAVFLPTTEKIKELIAADALGQVDYIYLPASANYGFFGDHWMNKYEEIGGSLMGSGGYALAFASYILDSPAVKAATLEIQESGYADYLCSLSFQLACKTIVNAVLGGRIKTVNRCYIYGTKGHIYLDNFWKSKSITLVLDGQEPKTWDFPYESEFTFYINHVSDLLKAGLKQSPIMSHELTLMCALFLDEQFRIILANAT